MTMAEPGFMKLVVWGKAHQEALRVYRITQKLPVEERFGLLCQMRRAASSIPANIAEGYGSSGRNRARFFSIAKTSADELRYYFILTKDLGFLPADDVQDGPLDEICAMLYRLRQNAVPGC
jgi:four helix bundle protein